MFRPGGYSSDEDCIDYDEYDYYSGAQSNNNSTSKHHMTEEELREARLNAVYNFACFGNTEEVIKELNEGFEVDAVLRDDWTLLMLATSTGNADLAIELITRGANVNQNKDMLTPLMAACSCPASTSPYEQTFKIVKKLVESRADVNAKSRKRMTALMHAASNGNILAVEFLLPLCNKHEEDNQNWTALFWAVNDKHVKIIQLLLDEGLDPNKLDVRRLNCLDYAKQTAYPDIIDLFPDPDKKKNSFIMQHGYYDFYTETQNPRFVRDVILMLQGMKCDALIETFVNMDLKRFLTLTLEDLHSLGIEKPYQQNRILGGIYRFHKYPYKYKSIPIIGKDETCTTVDIANVIMCALRHAVAMQAALKYLRLNCNEKPENILYTINLIEERVSKMKKIVKKLKKRTKMWDMENEPVDLIRPKKKSYKTLIISVIITLPVILYIRYK